jgi:hypothetical protein
MFVGHSAFVRLLRASGGFNGNSRSVNFSPGTDDGTLRSSIPNTGSPVTRLKMYSNQSSQFRHPGSSPSLLTSNSVGCDAKS